MTVLTRNDPAIVWLLEGDPAIRWQVMRDLLDEPVEVWTAEQRRTVEIGWVAQILAIRAADGSWPKGRWTDAPWTPLLLMALGLPEEHPAPWAQRDGLLDRLMPPGRPVDRKVLLTRMDLCHLGFWLGLGSTYLSGDPRLGPLAETVISVQLADGGWNCHIRNRPSTTHSSFNTTMNILENLRIAYEHGVIDDRAFREAEAGAIEFLLAHRLYRSHTTGEVADHRFVQLTYPWHWHYNLMRGLDYLRLTPALIEERASDALDLLRDARRPNGRWPLQSRIPGTLLVEMEKPGGESRWNTLRALRILRAVE
ncbi:MAG TPA: hypothetical protein VGO32_04945 [Candidatus Limnocylindria bacterium]|jgi:hypothetical protein|nr:hypothetical protein [Candidatus Limnocylindria bacterium]